jgi:septum formation protein
MRWKIETTGHGNADSLAVERQLNLLLGDSFIFEIDSRTTPHAGQAEAQQTNDDDSPMPIHGPLALSEVSESAMGDIVMDVAPIPGMEPAISGNSPARSPLIRTLRMRRLILASRSIHRRQILEDAGFSIDAIPPDVPEPELHDSPDLDLDLIRLAQTKAQAVGRRGAHGLILAADTVGFVAGRIFGKPTDRDDAHGMLQAISGSTHEVLTGWCLFRTKDQLYVSGVERTKITMRPWTINEFDQYLDSGEWIGKSGAYGLRLPDDPFVERIEGSAASVVGVPLERLQAILAEFNLS